MVIADGHGRSEGDKHAAQEVVNAALKELVSAYERTLDPDQAVSRALLLDFLEGHVVRPTPSSNHPSLHRSPILASSMTAMGSRRRQPRAGICNSTGASGRGTAHGFAAICVIGTGAPHRDGCGTWGRSSNPPVVPQPTGPLAAGREREPGPQGLGSFFSPAAVRVKGNFTKAQGIRHTRVIRTDASTRGVCGTR